jgi:hypothetical protein
MADAPKSTFELIVELIRALAWPILAVLVLISFWRPLHDTAVQIPDIVGRSDTITIAGLSLKVGRALRRQASPEVQEVLARLSPEGLKRVLGLSSSIWWDQGQEPMGQADVAELLRLGLVEEVSSAELQERNREDEKNFGYGVEITELGEQTQSFLQSVVAEFVQEVSRSAAALTE